MKEIRIISLALSLTALASISEAGGIPVLSLNGSGMLTWTNSFTNALFTVQWASSLGTSPTNTRWMEDWTALQNFSMPTGVTSVAVPMFYRVRCQPATVRLGDAFFDETSDLVSTNSYAYPPGFPWREPTIGGTNFYDGFGNYLGNTYVSVYAYQEDGNRVSGVNCIVVHKNIYGNPNVERTDYWVATDILGNMRVLQFGRGTNIQYTASPTDTPPIVLPGSVTAGQTWNRLGAWMTVIDTNAAFQGYTNLLEIQWVRSFEVDIDYYQRGTGGVFEYWYDSPPSGFKLRLP